MKLPYILALMSEPVPKGAVRVNARVTRDGRTIYELHHTKYQGGRVEPVTEEEARGSASERAGLEQGRFTEEDVPHQRVEFV